MPRAEVLSEGDTIEFERDVPQPIICCDCGLTHDLTLVHVADKRAVLKLTINARSTAQTRRHGIYKFRRRSRK